MALCSKEKRQRLRRLGFIFASFLLAISWSTVSTIYMMNRRATTSQQQEQPQPFHAAELQGASRNATLSRTKEQRLRLDKRAPLPATAVLDKKAKPVEQIPVTRTSKKTTTTVLLFPYILQKTGKPFKSPGIANAETKHVELDGIKESLFLNLSSFNVSDHFHDDANGVVWMGDVTGYRWNDWCDAFYAAIVSARNASLHQNNGVDVTASWRPIHIVDWSDYSVPIRCRRIEREFGKVKYSKRGQVHQRDWNETKQWVDQGFLRNWTREQKRSDYFHIPLTVRTDTVQALEFVLRELHNGTTLSDSIEKLPRSHDVIHLWPLEGHNHTTRVGLVRSKLRFKVSHVVHAVAEKHGYKGFVGVQGEAATQGRNSVKLDYIETLLDSKIVVVCGRDGWEDHYRLMEALVSGAMVFTDHMLALPRGLQNGTSLIEYRNVEDLQRMIPYYVEHETERLQIAAEGRRIAMSQHRSWHRVEEILFGEIRTKCPSDDATRSKCPYTVHINESIIADCSVRSKTVRTIGHQFPVRHLDCAQDT